LINLLKNFFETKKIIEKNQDNEILELICGLMIEQQTQMEI